MCRGCIAIVFCGCDCRLCCYVFGVLFWGGGVLYVGCGLYLWCSGVCVLVLFLRLCLLGLVLWSGGVFLAVVCLRKGSPQIEEGPMGQDRVSDHGRPVGAK